MSDKERIENLRSALLGAGILIHQGYCGTITHHICCEKISDTLAADNFAAKKQAILRTHDTRDEQ